jgi:predicted amidohydrolase YtcJ
LAVACIALLAIVTTSGAIAQQAADTIVTNGKILTVDSSFRTVEALAISNGRIVAAGTKAEIADLVVLDRDYMTVPAAGIRRIKPTMTMVGGRVVFEAARQ